MITAAVAADATGVDRVGNPRGRAQHLARRAGRTPCGYLPRGRRPVCGQPARRWHLLSPDTRPLCRRCLAWALRQIPDLPQLPYQAATPAQIHAALLEVTDPDELHRLVMALVSRHDLIHHVVPDGKYGGTRRLTAYVPAARDRCSTSSTRRNLP